MPLFGNNNGWTGNQRTRLQISAYAGWWQRTQCQIEFARTQLLQGFWIQSIDKLYTHMRPTRLISRNGICCQHQCSRRRDTNA